MIRPFLVASVLLAATTAHAGDHAARFQELQQELGLDDATAQRLQEALKADKEQRQRARHDLKQARTEMRRLVEAGSRDDAAFSRLMQQSRDARERVRLLDESRQQRVAGILAPHQQARLQMKVLNKMRHRRGGHGDRNAD